MKLYSINYEEPFIVASINHFLTLTNNKIECNQVISNNVPLELSRISILKLQVFNSITLDYVDRPIGCRAKLLIIYMEANDATTMRIFWNA